MASKLTGDRFVRFSCPTANMSISIRSKPGTLGIASNMHFRNQKTIKPNTERQKMLHAKLTLVYGLMLIRCNRRTSATAHKADCASTHQSIGLCVHTTVGCAETRGATFITGQDIRTTTTSLITIEWSFRIGRQRKRLGFGQRAIVPSGARQADLRTFVRLKASSVLLDANWDRFAQLERVLN